MQSEEYVLACYRYTELNPVRASMVQQPGAYRWSSYGENALGKPDGLVTPHQQYLQIVGSDDARREGYRNLFKAYLEPEMLNEIRQSTNCNFALGGERFKREIEEALGRRGSPGIPGRPKVEERR